MGRFAALAVATVELVLLAIPVLAQANAAVHAGDQQTTPATILTVRSNLVLVPALIKTRAGELVFALTANDFVLTDDGVAQPLQLEDDTDSQPLALAVVVQTGGRGAQHLGDYDGLGAVLDAIAGHVPHTVAVISFDSEPHLAMEFSPGTDAAAKTIDGLRAGDPGAAILDALRFGIDQLRRAPPSYRRAVLLLSETVDDGSQTSFAEALRAVDDTNTSIYSFGFSSPKAALQHEASKLPRLGGSAYSDEPYAAGGCMSSEPGADPDAHGKRSVQALDCASDLLPPLRLARLAFIAAKDGLKQNVPESVAELTGGEYYPFKNGKTLRAHLVSIANDTPNHYVLSFRPAHPHQGLHTLELRLKDRPGLDVLARKAYWVDAAPSQPAKTQ